VEINNLNLTINEKIRIISEMQVEINRLLAIIEQLKLDKIGLSKEISDLKIVIQNHIVTI
jgi:hypothetical protein